MITLKFRLAAVAALCAATALPIMVPVAMAQDGAPAISKTLLPALMTRDAEKGMLLGISKGGDGLIAVGANGVILFSSNGQSWRQVESPVDVALTSVAFGDVRHGWAVGHDALILGTADGGATWKVQNFQPELSSPLFGIQPLGGPAAIAVGAFGLLKTTRDGGASWSDIDAPELTGDKYHLNGITRTPTGKLVVVGERGLIAASDDGLQWRRMESPYEGSLFGVKPWGARGAVAFGMRGNVYVTNDLEVEPWQKLEVHTTASFFGGQVLQDGRVLLTGAEDRVLLLDPRGLSKFITSEEKTLGQPVTLTGSAIVHGKLVVIGENGVRAAPASGL